MTAPTGAIVPSPPFSRVLETMATSVSRHDAALIADASFNNPNPTPTKIPLPSSNGETDVSHPRFRGFRRRWHRRKNPPTSSNGETDECRRLLTPVSEGAGDDGTVGLLPGRRIL
ncbi:uncharacterized protein ARMOST_22380 [Armillaria ostoyae]|uniref:Uncharacterized protein n=1 Tax=Armillaria ostoyae TaxID=47428 RepID=A0A284SCR3_ARMOS|nr:uncharacterized protein ARMOST_22380 [Armillaria ostoyae]